MAPTSKTFQCNECGHQVQRPLAPMTCPACAKQRVGLFKEVAQGAAPSTPGGQPHPTPGQPAPTYPMPGQPGPGQVAPGQMAPGQPAYGQPASGQFTGQPAPISSPPVPGAPATPRQPAVNVQGPASPTSQPTQPQPTQPLPVQPAGPAPTPGPVAPTPVAPAMNAPAAEQPNAVAGSESAPSPPTANRPVPEAPEAPATTPPKKKQTRRESKPRASEPPPPTHHTPPEPPPAPPRAPEPPKTPEPPPKVKAKPVERSAPPASPTPEPSREPDALEEVPDTFAPAADSSDRVVWQFPEVPPPASKRRPLRNCVAVSSSGAIIAAVGAKVVSLEEIDGKVNVNWSYSTGARIPGSPALGDDDSVHVHSADGLLHCLMADGEQAWAPSNVGKPLGWSSPVVDGRKNTWLSGYSGGLMKLSADGSHINRRYFRSREKFDSTGVLFDGVFYVGCDDGFVYAIRLEDRKGHNLWDQRANRGLTDWFVNSSPAIAPGPTIVVGSRDDCVYGFGADGEVTWKVPVHGQMLASPVIDPKGRVLVTTSRTKRGEKGSGALIAISSNSHQIEWQYPTDAPCESTPVIGDDEVIYFGDNAGIIHAVDHEGSRVWTAKLGSPVRSAGSIVAPERVVFGLDNETLVALKCSSKGVAEGIWPKYMGTLQQSGNVSG